MDVIFFVILILVIAGLSIPFGRDSRNLHDHVGETPWERMPR